MSLSIMSMLAWFGLKRTLKYSETSNWLHNIRAVKWTDLAWTIQGNTVIATHIIANLDFLQSGTLLRRICSEEEHLSKWTQELKKHLLNWWYHKQQ